MTTLTFSPVEAAEVTCPPADTYVLRLVDIGPFEDRAAFQDPTTTNTQSRITFEIVDYDYDEDEDERDWNGTEVSDFFVFFKTRQNGERKETWKDDRSNAYKLLTALLGHEPEDGEDINLQELIGRRIKATVEPKSSGWPKITKPLPYKRRRKKVEQDPIDDDDVFNE